LTVTWKPIIRFW